MKWSLIIQAAKQAAIWLIHRFQKTEHEKRQEKYDKAMEDTKCWFRDHFQSDRLSDSDTRDRDTGSDASKADKADN